MIIALDRRQRPRFRNFARARRVETYYQRALRKVAKAIGDLVKGFPADDPRMLAKAEEALRGYARIIEPWAEAAGARMVHEVARRDAQAWKEMSAEMSRDLRREIETAPTGALFRELIDLQVAEIKSIPLEAAERVGKLAIEMLHNSARTGELAKEILATGGVAVSRANMLGRTMVSTAASALTQARAEHVGSPGYYWRTSRDADVRPSHRQMEGKFVAWNAPPTLDGYTAHAGRFANCRCWTEVVIGDEF